MKMYTFYDFRKMDDDICISGVAGRFPECENVDEFIKALLNGTDLITIDDRRFKPGE